MARATKTRASTRKLRKGEPQAGDARALATRLLYWYDRDRRRLPWRAPAGLSADPYHVWLSEIMLQQTTVKTVGPYFRAFIERWPNLDALASASLDEVLHAWQGLGYYARARNLHACAQEVSRARGGKFPSTEAELKALPGIGGYTAAAIAAIAFDRPAAVVDGNVERVIARLFLVERPLPAAKPRLAALAASLTPQERPGDFAQAMMDLGAVICTPRRPRCVICPLREDCAAAAAGIAEDLPARAPKAARPLRRGVVFWLVRGGSEILIQRRPEKGLLGGLMELPSTAWRAEPWSRREALGAAPLRTAWRKLPGAVRHVFTHFELELSLLAGKVGETTEEPRGANEGRQPRWCRLDRLSDNALPTLMKKVVAHALANGG
jgi:A/G-specific adenine glycosylase